MRLLLSVLLALAPATASAAQVRAIPAVAGAAPIQSAAAVRTFPVAGSALGLPLSRLAAAAPSVPLPAAPGLPVLPDVKRPSPAASAQTSAAEARPSRIVVSAKNFEMPEKPLDAIEVLSAILGDHPGMKDETAKELSKQVPAKLKAHFDEVLSRHRHVRSSQGGADVYEVSDGLGFWVDFMTSQDPLTRAGVQAFLAQSSRRIFSKDFAFDLVSALSDPGKAVTRILDGRRLSGGEESAVERLARARLDRVLRFLAAQGVLIDHDQHLAAAAFYHPLDDRLAYVMPSRADLNVLSHEGTHARFKRFEDALESWLRKKGYALPYEADGPRMALRGL